MMISGQWLAFLRLGFTNRNGDRTALSYREHSGPMLVQRALYPEGPRVCHVALLHPPSGIAGGDSLNISIDVQTDSHAALNTPGATRWYKANGKQAQQHITLSVAKGGRLDWLPMENIFFEETDAINLIDISIASGALVIGWEICQLGSVTKKKHWYEGQLKFRLSFFIDGYLFWIEQGVIGATDPVRSAVTGLNDLPVFATLWCFGPAIDVAHLDSLTATMAWEEQLRSGITVLPYKEQQALYLVRCTGLHAEEVRKLLINVWLFLRLHVLQVPGNPLRIWST